MEIQPIEQSAKVEKIKSISPVDQLNMTAQLEFVDSCVALLHEMPDVRPEICAAAPATPDPTKIADAMLHSILG